MITITEVSELRDKLSTHRVAGRSISLVPTMGNLHEGHLELIRAARKDSDIVVCSIFVNPLQFGPDEDLDNYPRTIDEDSEKLIQETCDVLFLPSVSEIYSNSLSEQTIIKVPSITVEFCGSGRPGHFDGVATVVCKLFNMVQPDIAYFGLKDYQQFLTIRKLVRDLSLNIDIKGVEIQRDRRGLALSSRNSYLTEVELESAPLIQATLREIAENIVKGAANFDVLEQEAVSNLSRQGMDTEYLAIRNAENLKPAGEDDDNLVILTAVKLGKCRLIDNIRFNRKP
jgi:pantoate--beta-alanine ligase